MHWPPRLQLANLPTPLQRLDRFSRRFDGVDIWVKHDELTGLEVSGNKIRKLEFTIAQALEEGCDTLITCGGVQSNHCRATAILGARLGLKVHLLLRGESPDVSDGNLLLDRLAGAEVTYVPVKEWSSHPQLAEQLQEYYRAAGSRAFFIPVGASDAIGLWGYVAASQELQRDLQQHNLDPDYIVVATGSGGTQAGLIAGRALFGIDAEIKAFNVSDDAAYFQHKVSADLALWRDRYQVDLDTAELPIHTVEGYLGPGYGQADADVFVTIAELARLEGLFLDPVYTGKAFHGMVSELLKAEQGLNSALPAARSVVFIHTGGLFGLFPQKQGFGF
ncbi:MAG: D-cysteine desulfhydrase family protein [Gammaproteobacteria bacterium]|nr:D-cysteine desulfhydrase family protein [Pseudomonadales bacterium]MCP5348178.1 D-cysteine desulfhydrase family protein [Pseudomonadales bacterium]